MRKRFAKLMVLIPLIFILSIYASFEQKILPTETVALAENVIVKGPFITPKLVSKEEFSKNSAYEWTDEVPFNWDIPSRNKLDSKTYHDFKRESSKDIPWPLEWPSRYENGGGEQFIPLAKPEDTQPKYIPIEPMEKKHKFLKFLRSQ
jgi:hypothetical protein